MVSSRLLSISSVVGVQIFDSRDNPTVMARMLLSDGAQFSYKVPSGASTGEKEALELRDLDGHRHRGRGVTKAVQNISTVISKAVKGIQVNDTTQNEFDSLLIELDGTPNKSRLGANAILAVSGAFARAQAHSGRKNLWRHFAGSNSKLPVPQFNVLNAGRHADTGFEVQETLVIPVGAKSFSQAMEMGTNLWHSLKSILERMGRPTGRGDEGGFVNPFRSIDETAEVVLEAMQECGYAPKKDMALAFDGAFSEIYGKDLRGKSRDPEDMTYHLGGRRLIPEKVVDYWEGNVDRYPIISLEDPLSENDPEGWRCLSRRLCDRIQVVLDDYICTNPAIIRQAIGSGLGNSHLIKLNQIGTVSETLEAISLTAKAGRTNVVSHRSGETEDDFIGHFSMHPDVEQIKSGSSGSERMAKYNALLVVEGELGATAKYRGLDAFPFSVKKEWQK